MRGVLEALRADIALGNAGAYEAIVHADVFSDLISQAEHLVDDGGYRRAGAVLVGATLEGHLRSLAPACGVAVSNAKGEHKKASQLNQDLYSANAYDKATCAQIDAWLKLRNDAAHPTEPSFETTHTDSEVRLMSMGVRDFIRRHPA